MRMALFLVGVLPMLGAGCAEKIQEPARADDVLVVPNKVVVAPPIVAQKPVAKTEPLTCIISSEPTCELGRTPRVTVTITNQTEADIYLVGSLDASDCKWRYPHCYFEVTGPDGSSAVPGIGRCGNMNTLRAKDFVNIPPGETFNPYKRIDDYGFFAPHQLRQNTFQKAGQYRIRFVYSTNSDTIAEWGGDGHADVAKNEYLVGMFRLVPKVEVKSNEIKVVVGQAPAGLPF